MRLLLCLILLLVSFGGVAEHESIGAIVIEVDVEAQSLEDALTQLAANHNIPIMFRSDSTKGIDVQAFRGAMSLQSALELLLAGSQLTFTFVDNTWVAITSPESVDGSLKGDVDNEQSSPFSYLDLKPPSISEVMVVGEYLASGCCRNSPSTATKTYIPTIEVPKSLEGIGADLFKDRGNATVSEAFRDYSSINVTDVQGNINVRGFKLSGRSILKDGLPIVSHGISSLTLNNIEGIEVAKGANSALYGFGQPGAVVNLITKKPREHAFTNITLSSGNYDQYFAVDSNGQLSLDDDLLYRFNGLIREEVADKKSRGALTQIEVSPSISYQINNTDNLFVAVDYSHQSVDGHGGIRPYDELNSGAVFGFDLFEVIYPLWEEEPSDFYPYAGRVDDEVHDSKIIELKVGYQGLTKSGWDFAVNAYYGNNKKDQKYSNDVSIWLNPIFDPHIFPSSNFDPLTYLKTLFKTNVDFIQNYQDARLGLIDLMQDKYGVGVENIIDALYNQGDNVPFWKDNDIRFYQIALDQTIRSNQFNIDVSGGKDFLIFNTEHFILLGLLHTVNKTENISNQRYSESLFERGAKRVLEATSYNDLYVGWALQRYAMHPWDFPFHPNKATGISLPTEISELAGVELGQSFDLDGSFPYRNATSRTTLTGFYLQDQVAINDNWKLLVSAGFYQFDREYDETSINSLLTLVGERQYISSESAARDNFFAPQIGITYLPNESLSLYVNYGLQYDLLNGLIVNQVPLDPEETETYETGLKWWPTEDYSVSLAVFQMTKNNWLLTDGDNVGYQVQEGGFRSTGGEFSLVGFVTPHIKTALNYTKTKIKSLKNPAGGLDDALLRQSQVGVPSYSGSLWVQAHTEPFGTHGWSFGMGISHMGKRHFNQQFVESKLSKYTLIDTALAYLHEDFRIALNIDNISDEKWVVGSNMTPLNTGSPRYLSEGPGIRFRITTELYY
mgnify:CR=1 FL=1